MRTALAVIFAWAVVSPAARAVEAPCWVDRGVLVVSASVMGIAGDYILDTADARTQLHETRAQGAGFTDLALTGEIRLAGLRLRGRPVAVTDLDARTVALPTPVAGVIGADILSGFVLDLSFEPCRVALHPTGAAPRFGPARRLPLELRDGRLVIRAAVSDGTRARAVALVPATGSDTAVRLDERLATVPGAARLAEFYPFGAGKARLRALSLGGELFENLRGGLMTAAEAGSADGTIGVPVLGRHRLRFDFPRGRVFVVPADKKGPPDRAGGP